MINDTTKTILLPKEVKSFDIVELPDFADKENNTKTKYLVSETAVYEMKQIGSDPKSMILEPSDTAKGPGQVVESSQVIVTSKFDIAYLLISALSKSGNKSFITIEDIIDTFEWIGLLPQSLVASRLHVICDTITEQGDEFYKLSTAKVEEFLKQRVQRLSKVLGSTKLVTQLKLNLYVDSEAEIPMGFLDQELRFTAYEIVMSYLATPVKLFDFEELTKYKKDIASKLVLRDLANVPQVSEKSKPAKVTKKKPAAKATKVAKGKGALDMFFKKK